MTSFFSVKRFLRHLVLPAESNNQRAKLLHPSALLLVIGLFLLFRLGLRQATTTFPDILGYASQIPPSDLIRLTNDQRQQRGLPLLKLDDQLSQAAARKAADMFARNYWAHVSPVGTQPWFFVTDSGYGYRYAGENLARDFSDAPSVVKAWMASATHRENLLSSRYHDIGIAVVDGNLDGRDTTLVVQLFGTRLSATSPSLGETASFTVQAGQPATASTPVVATPVSRITAFEVTKYFTFGLLTTFTLVLLLDVIIVKRRSIIRWTSRSFAHLAFVVVLLIAASTVLRGGIL